MVFVVACGKGKSGPDITPAAFGSKPVPPGRLAKVKAKMTQAEVKALYPDSRPTPNHSGSPSLTIDSDFGNADYRILFYSDMDAVASVDVEVPKSLGITDELRKTWGKPADELGGMPTWSNDDDGYEAQVWEMGRETRIAFKPFVALTPEFFGKAPGPVAQLAKVKFGMSWEQVKEAVPGLEGPKGGNGSYIPFQPGPKDVQLDVGFFEDKLDRMSMTMPARGVAMMAKAWGPPQIGKEKNGSSEMQCWDTADKALRIEVSTPQPGAKTANVAFVTPDHSFCEPR